MVNYANFVFPAGEERKQVCEVAETGLPNSFAAETLFVGIEAKRRQWLLGGLAWLYKLGLLQFS